MKTAFRTLLVLGVSFGLWLVAGGALATPVGPLNYQGRLLDNNGIPVTGSFNFVVRIYNDPVAGTLKYQETLNSVVVDDGVYAFRIGLGPKTGGDSLWDINLWQLNLNDLYLEIMVNGETLNPRHELTSAPHAYTATLALSADALGNKTAAEFDNILEGVCVSGQGKWLDKINKCLGVGAVVTGETLATMMETPDSNFKNLNLTSVDLTNSVFGAVSFTNSIFRKGTLSPTGFENADLGSVVMDDVSFTGAVQSASNLNLSYASFKNLDMSKWNLSSATLNGFSAANLTACPAALPTNWTCVDMDNPATGRYVLLGPGVNLSATSAAKVDTFGANTLDVHRTIFDGKNLSNANFQGISFNKQSFANTNLTGANFSYAQLTRILLDTTNLNNALFNHAVVNWMHFDANSTVNGASFSEANMRNFGFSAAVTNADFSYAIVEEGNFDSVSNSNFQELLGKGLSFGNVADVDFSNSLLFSDGDISLSFEDSLSGTLNFTNVSGNALLYFQQPIPATAVFNGGEYGVEGDIGGITISNVLLRKKMKHTGPTNEEGPTFHNVRLQSINFGGGPSSSGGNLRYATFTGTCELSDSFNDMSNANFTGTDFGSCAALIPPMTNWFMTICPDGFPEGNGVDPYSCFDQMTPAPGP